MILVWTQTVPLECSNWFRWNRLRWNWFQYKLTKYSCEPWWYLFMAVIDCHSVVGSRSCFHSLTLPFFVFLLLPVWCLVLCSQSGHGAWALSLEAAAGESDCAEHGSVQSAGGAQYSVSIFQGFTKAMMFPKGCKGSFILFSGDISNLYHVIGIFFLLSLQHLDILG